MSRNQVFARLGYLLIAVGFTVGVVLFSLRATELRKQKEKRIRQEEEYARQNPHIKAEQDLRECWIEIESLIRRLAELEREPVPAYFRASRYREARRMAGKICYRLQWMEEESLKWKGKMKLPVSLREIREVRRKMDEIY